MNNSSCIIVPNNVFRNELQKYIDTNKTTKAEVIRQLGVNSGSFYKFMNRGNYTNQWNATQNGTYWAAVDFLRKRPKKKKANKKRQAEDDGLSGEPASKMTKA